ncbi:hypothetical protein AOLI_G00314580 [Acnodon oligacanthus]
MGTKQVRRYPSVRWERRLLHTLSAPLEAFDESLALASRHRSPSSQPIRAQLHAEEHSRPTATHHAQSSTPEHIHFIDPCLAPVTQALVDRCTDRFRFQPQEPRGAAVGVSESQSMGLLLILFNHRVGL